MLCHLFERSLNINYMEFKNKLTDNKMRRQFILEPQGGMSSTRLWNDIKLTLFWRDCTEKDQEKFWDKVKDQQEKILEAVKHTDQFKR